MIRKRGHNTHPNNADTSSNPLNSSDDTRKFVGIPIPTKFLVLFVIFAIFGIQHLDSLQQQLEGGTTTTTTVTSSNNLQGGNVNIKSNQTSKKKSTTLATKLDDESLLLNKFNEEVHIVFSTDCSAFQHWQSYLLFYSAYKLRQPGKVTRIASGCKDEEIESVRAWHKENISDKMSERFLVHFTPHFSAVKDEEGNVKGDYKFFNKPLGLKHWFEYGEGMGINTQTDIPNNPDVIVALLDPDMILLREISSDFSSEKDVIVSGKALKNRSYKVEHGRPFGQQYGFGAQWRKLDLTEIAGADSPSKEVNSDEGNRSYPVGPPYIATATDMYHISVKWTEFVPKVHKEYPYLLAEMFAYCIAAAHLKLPHQRVDHMMVSNTNVGGEGWDFVDAIDKPVCELMDGKTDNTIFPLPTVIHYCQRYIVGEWFFGKRKMPQDFFECESPPLASPPKDLDSLTYKVKTEDIRQGVQTEIGGKMAKREAFMVCAITSMANEASDFFHQQSCDGVMSERRPINLHQMF